MTNEIRLQGIGLVQGKPAGDIKEGDVLYWNFGETSKVLKVVKETPKSLTVRTGESYTGNIIERRFLKTRIVATA